MGTTTIEVVKKITPQGGIAKTAAEILQRSRDLLSDEAHWVKGAMFCPITDADNYDPNTHGIYEGGRLSMDEVVERIMRDGLCGTGWGVCAVGAVSLMVGLNAVVKHEYTPSAYEESAYGDKHTVKREVRTLVTEPGDPLAGPLGESAPAVRVQRYKQAIDLLNAEADEYMGPDRMCDRVVWGLNDEEGYTHADVLAVFDRAIEKAKALA